MGLTTVAYLKIDLELDFPVFYNFSSGCSNIFDRKLTFWEKGGLVGKEVLRKQKIDVLIKSNVITIQETYRNKLLFVIILGGVCNLGTNFINYLE